MSFPKKYKSLIETTMSNVPTPDSAWLAYAVCVMTNESCGWGGWILEGVFKKGANPASSQTRDGEVLPGNYEQVCPACGRQLFRTDAAIRMVPTDDQARPLIDCIDYESVPITYTD